MGKLVFSLIVFYSLSAAAQEGISGTILGLTGDKRVKIAWGQDNDADGDHVFGESNTFRLYGYDTEDDTIRIIKDTLDDYAKPLITFDGERIVYSDRLERKVFVVNWDGSGRQQIVTGFAGAVWYDSNSGKEWVYYQENGDGDNNSLPLKRVNLDNPSEVELVWNDSEVNCLWMSISADGARIASSWPWPNCGVIVPSYDGGGGGDLYAPSTGYYDNGCWTTVSPDTAYRVGVFDGPHRAWKVWDWPPGSMRTLDLHSAPGIGGWEIYHPKMSNHPRFLTMTGPYSQGAMGDNNIGAGGPQIEVYFGKTDSGFTRVTDWVRVTNNNRADIYPCVWVDPQAAPRVRIDSFSAAPDVIAEGNSSQLSWSTVNATAVSIDQGIGGVNASGTRSVTPSATTTYTLTAEGQGGPVTRQATLTVWPAGFVHLKINSGDQSPAVAGWDDEDPFRTGGNQYDFSDAVDLNNQPNPAPEDVYLTCVHMDHSYSFPVADGSYVVRLHFFDNVGSSGRAMDYTIEGLKVLDDFSIIDAAGGGGKAWIEEFIIDVQDGDGLQITAEKDTGNDAFETGIEIISRGDDTQDPTISITAPTEGEVLSGDVFVQGTAADETMLNRVEVSIDGGAFEPASGAESWQYLLHTTSLSDGPHTITARATDLAGNSATDSVDVTADNQMWIAITSPAGGESWDAGSTQRIRWETRGVDNVTIHYSLDGGETYRELALTVLDTDATWGDLPWEVPNADTDRARIKIAEYLMQDPEAESELFTIVGSGTGAIILTAPIGGETVEGDSILDVCFEATDVDTVILEYTLDGGFAWDSIATLQSGDPEWGQFPWLVPNVSTPLARVRARTPDGTSEDASGNFTIVPQAQTAGPLEVTRVKFKGSLPEDAAGVESVEVAGHSYPVDQDGNFEVELEVPFGIEHTTVEIRAVSKETVYRRVVELELKDAIPGLGVSAQDLREFLGGQNGALAWVDGGGRIQILDFRPASPQVALLSEEMDCVNPVISPDGTRVVYSRGPANGPKTIYLRSLSGGDAVRIGVGDVGYWNGESIVYCDWSEKDQNGADGKTYRQALVAGTIDLDGDPVEICGLAMDAGPNQDASWLGQVYENLGAYNVSSAAEYPTEKFFLIGGAVADHQTCNGSMAPDQSGRLMCLVIPHDYVRIFTHETAGDTFQETSRFLLPAGMAEWEFPEWSTHPDYFTAVLRAADLKNRLFVVKVAEGELVPEVLELTDEGGNASYSHLYVEP